MYVEVSHAKAKNYYYGNSYSEYYNVKKETYNPNSYQDFFVYADKKGTQSPLFKVKDIEEDPSIG